MQAIVLVGGEGTRLRPLTSDVPKPAITLVDRPFLAYAIEWLGRHGVNEVVLACGFLPDGLRDVLGRASVPGPRIIYVAEPEPLGTAGAISFAAERSASARRSLPRPERRCPHRSRPFGADAPPRAVGAWPPSASIRSTIPPPMAWFAADPRADDRVPREARQPVHGEINAGPTCLSARSST